MTGRMRSGKYPHAITLSPEVERMARYLMERERRNLSNLVEKCIEEKYRRLPAAERGRDE